MANSRPRVIVGLDFGTTYSGFAFAHISDPEKVYNFFDYPKGGGAEKPYCKTLSGSYYKDVGAGVWQFKSWGFPARAEYTKDIMAMRKQRGNGPSNDPRLQPTVGTYFTKFKLQLASKEMVVPTAQGSLPPGPPVNVLITDYLREMGALVLKTLRNSYGEQLSKQAIQWCVTVPSIWDNAAKAAMKTYMTSAGLVNGVDGSRHPLIMVLEPEAASFFCHKVMSEQVLRVGDKLLVADIGGGTSDIVVQEVVSVGESASAYRVREVTTSSGGLCGGTYVDARYMEFLHKTIGPCLQACLNEHPNICLQLIQAWELTKANFGEKGSIGESTDIALPGKLISKWEEYDRRMGIPERDVYDELEISFQEMQSIFDPVVEQNVQLIADQLKQVPRVKVLVVVGGFAGSPYLMDCIRRRFAGKVPQIISPPNPGSAVCQGAVMLALNPDTVLCRVCKKTYGIECTELFDEKIDPPQSKFKLGGESRCNNRLKIYVRKGDKVDVNSCISETFHPGSPKMKRMPFKLFSSDEREPRYTFGKNVKLELEFWIDISQDMRLDQERLVKVSLFFGGSSMVIKAEAMNFSAGGFEQFELPVERRRSPGMIAVEGDWSLVVE
ncbi:hypothetical protein M758_1G123700 [Ceratodon purpureus]|nr:hypothetical protein M758_1G123700 [Ceratodon purpureus]